MFLARSAVIAGGVQYGREAERGSVSKSIKT